MKKKHSRIRDGKEEEEEKTTEKKFIYQVMYVFAAECYVIRLEFQFLSTYWIQSHRTFSIVFTFEMDTAEVKKPNPKRKRIIETHKWKFWGVLS